MMMMMMIERDSWKMWRWIWKWSFKRMDGWLQKSSVVGLELSPYFYGSLTFWITNLQWNSPKNDPKWTSVVFDVKQDLARYTNSYCCTKNPWTYPHLPMFFLSEIRSSVLALPLLERWRWWQSIQRRLWLVGCGWEDGVGCCVLSFVDIVDLGFFELFRNYWEEMRVSFLHLIHGEITGNFKKHGSIYPCNVLNIRC